MCVFSILTQETKADQFLQEHVSLFHFDREHRFQTDHTPLPQLDGSSLAGSQRLAV